MSLGGRTRGPPVGPELGAGQEVGSICRRSVLRAWHPVVDDPTSCRLASGCFLGCLLKMSGSGVFLAGRRWLSLQPRAHGRSGR